MKKQVVAAAIAIFVSHSAAKAIDIKSYDADPAFARKIGNWYQQAPAALKDRMFNPLVIVVKDRDILNTKIMQGAIHAPESTVPNRPDISAFANKGTPGKMPRRIIFIQSAMLKDIDEWQRHTVLHEMMHLFDGHPELFWRSRLQWLSNEAEFLAMFIAEKADYERKPKSKYNKWFDYYFSSPQEAYAEAGARAILPLVGARYREYNPEFDRLFSRVIGYVRKQLTEAGVKVRRPHDDVLSNPPEAGAPTEPHHSLLSPPLVRAWCGSSPRPSLAHVHP